MDIEALLQVAQTTVSNRTGKELSPIEMAILRGACQGHTYEQIADATRYSLSYLSRTVGPQLWQRLSDSFGEVVTKKNFRLCVERLERAAQLDQSAPQAKEANSAWVASTTTTQVAPTTVAFETTSPLLPEAFPEPSDPNAAGFSTDFSALLYPETPPPSIHLDWGEAVDVSNFYGRKAELETLTQWIDSSAAGETLNPWHSTLGMPQPSRCRLVALLGMGGIGKTSLSVKLAQQFAKTESSHFEFIIWRSLRNAPPLNTLLTDLLSVLSQQQEIQPDLRQFCHYLRSHRCLIVLDNLETLLDGEKVGQFRPGHESYGDLLRMVGETNHQSCLVLTSREKPAEVAALEGIDAVRSLRLSGSPEAAQAILQAHRLAGTEEQRKILGDRYSNSPLALKIVATSIRDLFDGEIGQFLAEDTLIFNGIRRLLEQQFDRLSSLEQHVMYWLSINREWTGLADLQGDLLPSVSKARLMEAVESLCRRSLIEQQGSRYTQQPVVMEYVTARLIDGIVDELTTDRPSNPIARQASTQFSGIAQTSLFHTHTLVKTTVRDYVRESQRRLILEPIAHLLCQTYRAKPALTQRFQALLQELRPSGTTTYPVPSYAPGNLINLAIALQVDLTGFDFSNLCIWHADLQKVDLHRVNFAQADLTKTLFSQTFGWILTIAFSPDGQLLALGDIRGDVYICSVAEGQKQFTCVGHTDWVWAVAFSPDGTCLASASDDNTVRLWDVKTGYCLNILRGYAHSVRAIAFHPSGQFLATGSQDQTVKIWDVTTATLKHNIPAHTTEVRAVAFSCDGRWIASGGNDRLIKLWDVQTGQCIRELHGHTEQVWTLAFCPDPSGSLCPLLASGSDDHTVKLWNAATGQCLKTLRGHSDRLWSVTFCPPPALPNNSSNPYLHLSSKPHPASPNCPDWLLASAGGDQVIRLWDVVSGECVRTLQGHSDTISAIACSPVIMHLPAGTVQVLASGSDNLKFWDVQSGQCLKTISGYINYVLAVSISPDGKTLVSSHADQQVRLWDYRSGQLLKTFQGHARWVWGATFSPDGRAIASSSEDHTLRIWDVLSGSTSLTLPKVASWGWQPRFSPNGQLIAGVYEDGAVRLWSPQTGQLWGNLQGHTGWTRAIAFSPDGQLIATGSSDCTIRLWKVTTSETLQIFSGHEGAVRTLEFTPDGRSLVSGSEDHTIRLWDTASGECVRVFAGHTNSVQSLAFSTDGQWLVSASEDHTVRCWDLKTGAWVRSLQAHAGPVSSVAIATCNHPYDNFLMQGDCLITASEDETIKLWELQTGKLLKTLRPERLYEGMNIWSATGIHPVEKATLSALGAIEAPPGEAAHLTS